MKTMKYTLLAVLVFLILPVGGFPQKKVKQEATQEKSKINTAFVNNIKWRSIGPAFTSGRIGDFAVNPKNNSEYYVAVSSGHIWKTQNRGITWEPVFDNYGVYSIGCLTMDPNNTNVIWTGTGENNHQRALGYGNGVYKSVDGGKSWKNMGLKESRQIGMIAIDPRNSDMVYVAAEGSAWGPGGERGLYKSTDGGQNWKKILNISDNTGVNNIIIDPSNPDILFATSEQRRRHVFTKISGGPESAVYKSTDAGATWRKIEKGLPSDHKGGMGIAISPVDPNVWYVIIEAAENSSGFFRSTDKGESWTKMSSHASSGQYYNEIFCDPVDVNIVYSVETVSHVTRDGGKTFTPLGLQGRHVDDHALWINPADNKNFIIGGDGGIYETYDGGINFRFVSNLPVTQFYRVYLDNDYPFYNVYGGTQDNNSMGGPSRNRTRAGVSSDEWITTLGGDGFWGAVDPNNPNIVYSEYQYGNIYRYDKKSGESIYIKPQPGRDEDTYRWNWNTPFVLSHHSTTRLYIAANKVFRSDDRGNSWTTISPDLTTQIDRNTWPVMGKYWSIDAVMKDVSTSLFNTIVSFAESPVNPDLLFVGTDDGLIQTSTDGGKNWQKISSFTGVPEYTYVSDIMPSKFDENIVFASFSNLKRDDFKPYILKSTDKGQSWKPINSDLPANGSVHVIEQDFKDQDLLFVGTEFGVFFTHNGGSNWVQLKSGIPAIAVYDLAIQKRECDLVAATFGRGFYIIDDYSPLRDVKEALVNKPIHLFPVKDALSYIQTGGRYGQGATYFLAKNPDFGATFTFYFGDSIKTSKALRKEREKKLFDEGKPIPQLSLKEQDEEAKEEASFMMFVISDKQGNVVRKLTTGPAKGLRRINWDLRYENLGPLQKTDKYNPATDNSPGALVPPGTYNVKIAVFNKGEYKDLGVEQEFMVRKIENGQTFPAQDMNEVLAFTSETAEISARAAATLRYAREMQERITTIRQTIVSYSKADHSLMDKAQKLAKEIDEIVIAFEGLRVKASYEEIPPHKSSIMRRLGYLRSARSSSTEDIMKTEKEQLDIVKLELIQVTEKLRKLSTEGLPALEKQLDEIKAPWTPGRTPWGEK
jgi:photosystem II stability/assembly factor-like uncharacterized protein